MRIILNDRYWSSGWFVIYEVGIDVDNEKNSLKNNNSNYKNKDM